MIQLLELLGAAELIERQDLPTVRAQQPGTGGANTVYRYAESVYSKVLYVLDLIGPVLVYS